MKFTEAELIDLENIASRVFSTECDCGRIARHGMSDFTEGDTLRRLIEYARASAVEPIAPFPGKVRARK